MDPARVVIAGGGVGGLAVALAALALDADRVLARIALVALSLGLLLFSGSVAMNVLVHWPTTLAPLGGMLLISGWIAYAADRLRR